MEGYRYRCCSCQGLRPATDFISLLDWLACEIDKNESPVGFTIPVCRDCWDALPIGQRIALAQKYQAQVDLLDQQVETLREFRELIRASLNGVFEDDSDDGLGSWFGRKN